ncbi:CapA family protein [Falsarthrobacter nasiphocae]|uniref:Poly-gamma-glutamate synthesis protein (Capsule biosynthesis protein) n=1 Tax=Falsarthrobacter nasiphocae TaxID=189863 RepID=A0AAE4C778_9MICC|nr:CapA family protein [Falsarthrobacter nasiphocae]MDR6892957.1 poly-gamma-glutamate synthesis protein (capsule biosynthesis protein) [Falsarthrobacter nasiphocae]
MPRSATVHRAVTAATLGLALALAGCASDGPGGTAPSGGGETGGPSSSPSAAPRITESAAGKDACGEGECFSLSVSGDFLLHEGLWRQAEADARTTGGGQDGLDFGPLIAAQKPYLAQADLSMCQMETPLADAKGPYSAYPSFNVPPQILPAAKAAGYDACTMASNHTIDQGVPGVERTRKALAAAKLGSTGGNLTEAESKKPAIFTSSNGVKVAVVTGTYGLNGIEPDVPWRVDTLDAPTMIAKAKAARAAGADIVLANMHAGEEYASVPNEEQTTTAHALVDSGQFDLIYGEHTHSVLPIEKYKGTWIVYGLGNNLTELSPWYPVNNEGLMVNAVFGKKGEKWTVTTLRWAPSLIVKDPYRWCPVGTVNPAPTCAPAAAAAESRARTTETVNSMGADKDGAVEWKIAP